MLPPRQALEDTVQSFAPPGSTGPISLWEYARGRRLPPRGTKDRDRVLRLYDADEDNTLWQGGRSGITKKVANLPFVLNGPTAKVQYWQDRFGQANFGHGWEYFSKLGCRDFLTQSYGFIIEIAGPGDPTKPLLEAPTGINHLDAGRCYVTGNPIYPILYYSLWDGRLHRMHASRVYQMVDDPIADERYFGIGTCALERAIAVCSREIRIAQYMEAKLDDAPQPGLLSLTGMTDKQWQVMLAKYITAQQAGDSIPTYGRTIVLTSLDPNAPVKAEQVPFAQAPELFDFAKYTDVDIDSLALAIGVDRQELWQLSGGKAIGTASQSETLALKSRGKFYADWITGIERFVNWALLPDDCEFKIEEQDTQEDARQAALDKQIVDIGQALITMGFKTEVVAQLLTQQSKTFRDAFGNDLGQVQATSSTEQVTPQVSQDANLGSETPAPTEAQTAPQVVAQTAKATTAYKFNPNHEADTGQFAEGSGGGSRGGKNNVATQVPSREYSNSETINNQTYISYKNSSKKESDTYFKTVTSEITEDEANALNDYVNGYDVVEPTNYNLRMGKPLSDGQRQYQTQLDNLTTKNSLPENALLWRGVSGEYAVDMRSLEPGDIFIDDGFCSTSLQASTAVKIVDDLSQGPGDSLLIKVAAPKGTKGVYVNAAFQKSNNHRDGAKGIYSKQQEFILARQSKFKVVGLDKPGDYYILTVEVVND